MKPNTLIKFFIFFVAAISLRANEFFFDNGIPKPDGTKTFDITVITNAPYVVGYDETRRNPVWAAYRLVKTNLNHFERPDLPYAMDDKTKSKVPTNGYEDNPKEQKIGKTKW